MIPVIDLFAGPGGLGEGFSAFDDSAGNPAFKIGLSIEKDPIAHETLKLRSFFRQFCPKEIPDAYYDHLRGKIDRSVLYALFPIQAARASAEAWRVELGNPRSAPLSDIDKRIRDVLRGARKWVLIGGPPCQAYSVVGRSRVLPVDRREGTQNYEKDKRHFLYKAYLRIIAEHAPPVFVLENVKGILSAEVGGKRIIERLLSDLRFPSAATGEGCDRDELEYDVFPLADYDGSRNLFADDLLSSPAEYVVRSETHLIPQARHRLILLGLRKDLVKRPGRLRNYEKRIDVWSAISDLPKLRSKLSREEDSGAAWVATIRQLGHRNILNDPQIDPKVRSTVLSKLEGLSEKLTPGAQFLEVETKSIVHSEWFHDSRLGGACNHAARGHMDSDLWRYFVMSCYALVHGESPKLSALPRSLFPNHKNLRRVRVEDIIFSDRFRVQVKHKPAMTITSHIGKDGHSFIHPDPLQCRSLTVREAARLQTFPDNYFFAGPTTVQYQQVGNAVPPLLAKQIAAIVHGVLANKE
jgi:DNA (cytosine-5)-methyltransferase 1